MFGEHFQICAVEITGKSKIENRYFYSCVLGQNSPQVLINTCKTPCNHYPQPPFPL